MPLIRSLFIPRVLALLAVCFLMGCGVPSADEDARVCADVECTAGRCVSESGTPVCRCSAWDEAAGLSCTIAAVRPQDDHGDTPALATPLVPSTEFREGTLQPPFRGKADRDVFAMPAQAGQGFRFVVRPGTLAAVDFRLMDAAGKDVAGALVRTQEGQGVEFASTEAAPRFIMVTAPQGKEAVGTYSYRLEDLGKDAHGSTPATATAIQESSGPFPVAIEYPGDADVFSFRTEPGHGFQFSCASEEASLALLTEAGAVLASSEGERGKSPRVGHVGQGTSTWFVKVYARTEALRMTSCEWKGLGRDEHSNAPAGATPLVAGVPVSARLHGTNDVDVFSFSGTAGHHQEIWLLPSRIRNVRLTAPDGRTLEEFSGAQVSRELPLTGTYYVQVLQDAEWGSEFQVRVDDKGPDDHGGLLETATRAALGERVTGRLDNSSDWDAIAVPLEPDGVYRLTCTPVCSLFTLSPSDSVYLKGEGYGIWHVLARSSGLATFRVGSYPTPANFTFQVDQVGTDDHGDVATQATPVTVPVSLAGVFELGGDMDVFSVELEAGRSYVLDFGNAFVRVLGPNGATVSRYPIPPTQATRFKADVAGRYMVEASSSSSPGTRPTPWQFSLRAE
ncbi:PPC domain-containing protein [Myxococcus landrumensis]|uniref:PPC domain-containing protein n=1 Tax=Myxococcus landrumensis TaxID=2813577 RepID=A0ABX7NF89_9BACT|nr:PPC domain-containing protein [Myxococcus landrumus]QSQ17068.1 PPC domain-containing protein [Myxococcus landrumus]